MSPGVPGSGAVPPEAAPAPPAGKTRARPKPASYRVALLLILAIIIAAEVVAEVVLPVLQRGDIPTGNLVLLGLGASALVGLLVLNARWLWVTIGNLRFALALITIWGISSILGTLVVQRLPNQTDGGYERTFLSATGDFLYNMTHFASGGVVVHPEPDVQRWLDQQYRVFGKEQGEETEKTWIKGEEGRLRAQAIVDYTREHDALLHDILSTVSVLRLPEAFQISIWFKALLGLLCVALVSVVIQRWRGEWRQVGWAMAHFGMVIFIVGATVRATHKVDGLLPMHVGDTADWYFRNVSRAEGPLARVNNDKQTMVTPLDFAITLHRFKTEYPKQLFVAFRSESEDLSRLDKSYRVDKGWSHPFLDGQISVHVDRLVENVAARVQHREDPDGPLNPAVQLAISAPWLPPDQELALASADGGFHAPDDGYRVQYERATDEQDFALLTGSGGTARRGGNLYAQDGSVSGYAVPGRVLQRRGDAEHTLAVVDIWPDFARRTEPDGRSADPRDPVVQLEVRSRGARLGDLWVGEDRMVPDPGLPELADMRFQYDHWPVNYRLVDKTGGPLVLATFREGQAEDTHELSPGAEVALDETGNRLRLLATFERHASGWHTGPADTRGMTPEDIYYASLPTALELTVRGPPVERLAQHFAHDQLPAFGVVTDADFERGEGSVAATPDGAGLRVRLVSDQAERSHFPDDAVELMAERANGEPLPIQLDWVTNEHGAPLRFTSDVTLSQNGKPIKRGLVEPNRPIYLAGFQFSQADFNKDDPTYSAFGVVRDPSVRIVYFGMAVLVLGVILLFYLYPVIARRFGGRSLP